MYKHPEVISLRRLVNIRKLSQGRKAFETFRSI